MGLGVGGDCRGEIYGGESGVFGLGVGVVLSV